MPHRRLHRHLEHLAEALATALRGPLPRWVLTPFIALPIFNGTAYAFGPASWFTSPAFGAAKDVAPMWVWGTVAIAGAVVTTAGVLRYSTPVTVTGLLVSGVFFAWWAGSLAWQAYQSTTVPPSGAAYVAFIANGYLTILLVVVATWPTISWDDRRPGGRNGSGVRRGGRE